MNSSPVKLAPVQVSTPAASVRRSARRRLDFGADTTSTKSEENSLSFLTPELMFGREKERLKNEYGFDPDRESPARDCTSHWEWEKVCAKDIPDFYTRPIHRKPARPRLTSIQPLMFETPSPCNIASRCSDKPTPRIKPEARRVLFTDSMTSRERVESARAPNSERATASSSVTSASGHLQSNLGSITQTGSTSSGSTSGSGDDVNQAEVRRRAPKRKLISGECFDSVSCIKPKFSHQLFIRFSHFHHVRAKSFLVETETCFKPEPNK